MPNLTQIPNFGDKAAVEQDFNHQTMNALIIGASGGIGLALVDELLSRGNGQVIAAARQPSDHPKLQRLAREHPKLQVEQVDYADEGTISALAAKLVAAKTQIHLLFVATGMLHAAEKQWQPERQLKQLDEAYLAASFHTNTIGPLLVVKHLHPLLTHGQRAVLALLSARVGSISDNGLGGWYGYRASKAALNMASKGFSVELRRRHPEIIVAALHPGTVDTALSEPFQARVPSGALFTPSRAATQLLNVIDQLESEDSGGFLAWDGQPIPW